MMLRSWEMVVYVPLRDVVTQNFLYWSYVKVQAYTNVWAAVFQLKAFEFWPNLSKFHGFADIWVSSGVLRGTAFLKLSIFQTSLIFPIYFAICQALDFFYMPRFDINHIIIGLICFQLGVRKCIMVSSFTRLQWTKRKPSDMVL